MRGSVVVGGAARAAELATGLGITSWVVATALLGFKVGWTLPKMALVMLAGCVPFLSFWVERKVAAEVEGRLAHQ